MGFALFILVNATLFIRPGDFIPDLGEYSPYQAVILICFAVSFPRVFAQLAPDSLRQQPVTICVLGLLVAIPLSHLTHLNLSETHIWTLDFAKTVLYYFLVIGLVNSPGRLRWFLRFLVVFVVMVSVLSVLEYHDVIEFPNLTTLEEKYTDPETGQFITRRRLRGTGIFSDPNDICLILALGFHTSLYNFGSPGNLLFRSVWLLPLVLFGYTVKLTQSRGGLLGFGVGLLVLIWSRYGWRKALPLVLAGLPVLLIMFGGRQTSIDLENKEDTGMGRILLWAEGFQLMKYAPLFGIGAHRYGDEVGFVAHNSFVHAFTELGLAGGALFAGAFYFALTSLRRLGSQDVLILDPEMQRLRSYLLALVAGYVAGAMSLSRCYNLTTYLVLGLPTAYLQAVRTIPPVSALGMDRQFVKRVALVGIGSLAAFYFGVRILAR